ncbi:lipopolysaccharide biosynthesis protein [Synechocystis sp. LKSZ1]|uniref:lipopolysaccharide biosynthesis protein n=1 Tax=Synechocystis sp. LKSZ1 TaxID=3144951 RepID=UPI00336C20D8
MKQWLQQKIAQIDSPFVRNVGWLGSSGAIIRVSRLLATIILARFLTPQDYGLAALVLTTNEFVRVFTRNGVVARLIQVEAEKLPYLTQAAYWLNWAMFIGLFLIQCLVAFPIAWFYRDQQIILPICVMGLNLLWIPLGLVQAALLQREGRFKVIALTELVQISTDNLLSAVLAIAGLGMWAIILPKILVAPIWVYIITKNNPWRPTEKFSTQHWSDLFGFGRSVLGVELLNTLRANLDYLIIGRFLSLEALGLYYFAFNAGLGISLGIITSIKAALLPHLCEGRDTLQEFRQRYYHSLKTIGSIITPLVVLQSSLAPFYVPLVFGQRWTEAIPILILICLSALPRPFADSASQLLLAIDKPELDLYWNLGFTALFAGALLLGVQGGSLGVAWAVLLSHWLCLPLFIWWTSRYVFKTA